MAQVKPALEYFSTYRRQVDPVDGALLDTLLLEWLQTSFGLREAQKLVRSMSDCLIPIGISGVQTDIAARPLTELLADPELEQEAEWLVTGYAGRGILTLVSGHPKVGKTTWLAHLASTVAAGKWFLGAPTTESRVLWLDLEQHPARTVALFRGLGDEGIDVSHTPRPSPDAMRRYITDHDIGLVVVDSLSKLLGLEDENDAATVTLALAPWLELCRDTNTGMMAIHHLRKSGGTENMDVRGSSAINAIVDISIALRRLKDGGDATRELEAISRYGDTPDRVVVELEDGVYHRRGTVAEVKEQRNRDKVLEVLTDEPQTAEEVGQGAEMSAGVAQKTLKGLYQAGVVTREGKGISGSPYEFMSMECLSAQTKPIYKTDNQTLETDLEDRYEAFLSTGTEMAQPVLSLHRNDDD